jgi:hypothetical protein
MRLRLPFLSRTALAIVAALLTDVGGFHQDAAAQIAPPLDVTASQPIYNSDGATLLLGSNPYAASFGYPVVAGCLVQVIDAGSNGIADAPDYNGNPTGDDAVIGATTIGSGIAPDVTLSGRFSASIYPPPATGSRVYIRVFNAPTSTAATCYGQSSLFIVAGVNVLDASALGLAATLQPRTAINGTNVTYAGTFVLGSNSPFSTLVVTNGGVLTSDASVIGNSAASGSNSVWVGGAGSVWNNTGNLTVGNTGSFNSLWVGMGGQVLSSNIVIGAGAGSSNNAVNLAGGNLSATNSHGDGFLEVRNGALTVNAGTVTVNQLVSTNYANSLVNVNGGSLVAPLVLNAGQFTMTGGTLNVVGAFTNAPGGVFAFSGGNAFVPLQMNNMGLFTQSGGFFDPEVFTNSGSFILSGGMNVDEVFLNLASGTVLQSGGEHNVNAATNLGSWFVSGGVANLTNLFIEFGGVFTNAGGALVSTGSIDVRNGVFVLNSGTVMVNQLLATNFASSVMAFNGGTLNSGGSTVNNGSIFQVGDGSGSATLHLNGGTHSFANGLFINTNATLSGTGAITGVITNAGSIAPGDSAGVLSGSSSLTLLGNSLLVMQLAGTNDWLYDQIVLAGALNFGGTLNVSLLDGFTVGAGNRFDLFDFSGSSGAFSLTNLPGLDPLMYWDTSALYSTGEIEADWMTGALQVTLSPAAAIGAGAQWQVDGGVWQNSGDTVTNLVIGDHTLAFKDVAGWVKPTNRVVQIAFGETTVTNGSYELTPTLLAAVSRKTHGAAGAFDLSLNLNSGANPTVEPRKNGPTQVLFTFNKTMAAMDGVLSANEFTLTNATFVSANMASSNLTLNLTNAVDQSKVTVVLKGLSDLAGNALAGTNEVRIGALYGDANQSGSVSIGDMGAMKAKLSPTVTVTNFLCDANLTGSVTIGDMQVAKNNLAHSVPLGGLTGGGTFAPSLSLESAFAAPAAPVFPATLGEALGAPELAWSTNGDEVWSPTLAPDGSVAAWSGSIGDLNVSWLETTVTGLGTITFQWKASSELNGDWLTFSVDGVEQPGRISGETDWQTLTFSISSGTHRLTWTYAKNRANAVGYDAGWVRRVNWQRSP